MTDQELIACLRMVTGFIRFETGDRVAASICLSEKAADRLEALMKDSKLQATLLGEAYYKIEVLTKERDDAKETAPTVTAGWPTEEGEGSIIVGEVKGDNHD
jgi:hypothetical protein